MRLDHKSAVSEAQLDMLTQMSLSTSQKIFKICPFCNCVPMDCASQEEHSRTEKPDQLLQHIASHLRVIAYMSLPPRYDREDSSGDSTSKPSESVATGAGNKRTADTDLDKLSLIFDDATTPIFNHAVISTSLDNYQASIQDPMELRTELVVDPAWSNVTSREEEWGFSPETSYPHYGGIESDKTLQSFLNQDRLGYLPARSGIYRMRGIPLDHSLKDIEAWVPRALNADPRRIGLTIRSLAVDLDGRDKVAILGLQETPASLLTPGSEWYIDAAFENRNIYKTDNSGLSANHENTSNSAKPHRVTIDVHFNGLTVLKSFPDDTEHKIE
jgi:hypothetical protein